MGASGTLGKWGIGIVLVAVGVALLLNNTGVIELGNLIRWTPSLLILLGILMMVVNRFRRNAGPIILIAVGVVVQLIVLGFSAISLLWPALLILIGLVILFGRGRRSSPRPTDARTAHNDAHKMHNVEGNLATVMGTTDRQVSHADLSGEEIVTVMGTSKLDMRDITISDMPAELNITCVMGQVNIRVPSDLSVAIDNSTVMGQSKDDRRGAPSSADAADLTITGTVVMGSLKVED